MLTRDIENTISVRSERTENPLIGVANLLASTQRQITRNGSEIEGASEVHKTAITNFQALADLLQQA